MELLLYFIVFILGNAIGSFLNVCIYRIPEGISIINPPSRCPSCETRLKPLDLFPIFSWVMLWGKCRYCGEKISPRYMLVELLTGALFALTFYALGLSLMLLAAFTLTALLITITFIDIDTRTIPNGLIIFGLAAGALFALLNIAPGVKIGYWDNALDALLGLAVGFVPLLIINLLAMLILKKEGMGGGDMKMMAAVGLFLGLKLTVVAMIIAIYVGGIAGAIILISARIKERKKTEESDSVEPENKKGHYMAFGPFLALGSFVSMLFGSSIVDWYINILLG